jgi:hypothetical protein
LHVIAATLRPDILHHRAGASHYAELNVTDIAAIFAWLAKWPWKNAGVGAAGELRPQAPRSVVPNLMWASASVIGRWYQEDQI